MAAVEIGRGRQEERGVDGPVHECTTHLRAHGKRKGADEIRSVRIRRVTVASVMPSVGGEVILGREALAAAALAGGRRLGEGWLTSSTDGQKCDAPGF
jgi:hypothetical protein